MSQEYDEEACHFGIRIRELQLVPLLGSLGPVEHAPGQVHRLTPASQLPSFVLRSKPVGAAAGGQHAPAGELSVERRIPLEQRVPLLIREVDVAHP
jgi:hypothetical protein